MVSDTQIQTPPIFNGILQLVPIWIRILIYNSQTSKQTIILFGQSIDNYNQ